MSFLFIRLYKHTNKITFTRNVAMNVNAFEGANMACDASACLLPITLK